MNRPRITWISADDPPEAFPDVEQAAVEPDGLLAAGGDLEPERLLYAYRHGIFPWYDDGQPILWWSPDPRCAIRPESLHVSRRLRRSLRNSDFELSFNRAFADVIGLCAGPRPGQSGTWITSEMERAYVALHRLGWAHSVEVWREGELAGGLYGLCIGRAFFGESMFTRSTNASKAAMTALCRLLADRQFEILDCQVVSPHLESMGATLMSRAEFSDLLRRACEPPEPCTSWPDGPCNMRDFLTA